MHSTWGTGVDIVKTRDSRLNLHCWPVSTQLCARLKWPFDRLEGGTRHLVPSLSFTDLDLEWQLELGMERDEGTSERRQGKGRKRFGSLPYSRKPVWSCVISTSFNVVSRTPKSGLPNSINMKQEAAITQWCKDILRYDHYCCCWAQRRTEKEGKFFSWLDLRGNEQRGLGRRPGFTGKVQSCSGISLRLKYCP